jgi:hypothetical protein
MGREIVRVIYPLSLSTLTQDVGRTSLDKNFTMHEIEEKSCAGNGLEQPF